MDSVRISGSLPLPRVASDIYNGRDPYSLPLYSQREAAHIVGASPSTVRGWVTPGARGAEAIIRLPEGRDGRLSFYNVVEAFVLNQIRGYRVSMHAVRAAVEFAERELGVDRLLIRPELRWEEKGRLFWDELTRLTKLDRSGQLAIREVVGGYLNRVEWDDVTGLPRRFFPTNRTGADTRGVAVDPRVGFGQPTVAGTGVGTAIIVQRVNAGEDPADVAADYGVDVARLTEALVYETAR